MSDQRRSLRVPRLMALVLAAALAAGACRAADLESALTPTGDADPTAEPEVPTPPAEPLPAVAPTQAPPPAPPPRAPSTQLRGIWIHLFDDTLKSPEGIDRMLDAAAAANINTIIPEVVRRHDAYYRSDVLPRTPDPALAPGFDILEHLIAGARQRGMAIHAWFPAMPTYHHAYNGLPRPEGWIWQNHGPQAPEAQRWVTRRHNGNWDDYLDPGVPQVQAHVTAIAAELAANYDIDAVHVDYVRYVGAEWGYNPIAVQRFQAETGRTDVPGPHDAQWSDWRREQTRTIAAMIREAVTAANPQVGVSQAVIAWGEGPHAHNSFEATRTYNDALQDWPRWMREGLVDAVFPMTYFVDARHRSWYDQWVGFQGELARSSQTIVAPGLGTYLNPPDASESQLAAAVERTDGAVIYSYQQNASQQPYNALLQRVGAGMWAQPAAPPRLR